MPKHWQERERKVEKRKNGMRVDNRGIFVLRDANRKRDEKKLREVKQERKLEAAYGW